MTRVLIFIFLLAVPVLSDGCRAQGVTDGQAAHADVPIIMDLGKVTPFAAVLRIARENRAALGIVVGARPLLCAENPSMRIDAPDVTQAFALALSGTGYTISAEGGVYVLTAPDPSEKETKLLNYRFQRFTSTNGTIEYAGALLAGYIKTSVGGAQGFAIDSLSGPSSSKFTIKMEFASTREIANRIVSQKGKAVWILRPTLDTAPSAGDDTSLQIYSYDANAKGLEGLTCDNESNAARPGGASTK